jgi:hypothetical protein
MQATTEGMERDETPGGMLMRTFFRKSIIERLFGV